MDVEEISVLFFDENGNNLDNAKTTLKEIGLSKENLDNVVSNYFDFIKNLNCGNYKLIFGYFSKLPNSIKLKSNQSYLQLPKDSGYKEQLRFKLETEKALENKYYFD